MEINVGTVENSADSFDLISNHRMFYKRTMIEAIRIVSFGFIDTPGNKFRMFYKRIMIEAIRIVLFGFIDIPGNKFFIVLNNTKIVRQ